MLYGLIAGIAAGALWGLTFVAPLVAAPFSPFDLTVARYAIYGAFSIAILARRNFAVVRRLTWADLALLTLLGASGNVAYYLAMAIAVPLAGTALVALIIGCLPVIIAIIGNTGTGRVAWRDIAMPLGLIGFGLLLVNVGAFAMAGDPSQTSRLAAGLGLTVIALALWAWDGLRNARAMHALWRRGPMLAPSTGVH